MESSVHTNSLAYPSEAVNWTVPVAGHILLWYNADRQNDSRALREAKGQTSRMRFSPFRRDYLQRMERLLRARIGGPDTDRDWLTLRNKLLDDLYLFLYGLPAREQILLVHKAIQRYLPNFTFRYPHDERAPQFARALEWWLQDPEEGIGAIRTVSLGRASEPRQTQWFLWGVIETLQGVILGRLYEDSDMLPAAVETMLWQYTYQRGYDVWSADNPVAAWGEERHQELVEHLMFNKHQMTEGEKLAMEEQIDRVFVLFNRDDECFNEAAIAVQHREWRFILDNLRELEAKYPDAVPPTRRARRIREHDLVHAALAGCQA